MSEKPANAILKPAISLPVVVVTSEKIDGQNEHAAIITKVISDDCVNVTLFPSAGVPYPIPSVYRVRHSAAASLGWRFPSRSRT